MVEKNRPVGLIPCVSKSLKEKFRSSLHVLLMNFYPHIYEAIEKSLKPTMFFHSFQKGRKLLTVGVILWYC